MGLYIGPILWLYVSTIDGPHGKPKMSPQRSSVMLTPRGIDFVLSRRQAADVLGVSMRTLTRMEAAGNGPSPRCRLTDRRFGYRASVISKFVQDREENVGRPQVA